MPRLLICQGERRTEAVYAGQPLLADVLALHGFAIGKPCGGRGVCGKCAVRLVGNVSAPTARERELGVRLACQSRLLGDCEVVLPDAAEMRQIELHSGARDLPRDELHPMPGRFGAAIDIGTTTLAVKRYDLRTGRCVGEAAALNPQTSVAADVMGRIGAAMDGRAELLQAQIVDALSGLLARAAQGGPAAEALVVTGNTTMLYLLTGRDPTALSHAPFEADCLFGEALPLLGAQAYLPRCMNAFVGADITCAALACGLCDASETALLCDIGTNGEIALWKDGRLYVTSTAAGPAFEGAGISCGCGSVRGAIDRVWIENGRLGVHTIGDAPAVGVCGSGLIDAIAALLALGEIDETGATDCERLPLAGEIALLPRDVRAVQLAKAAIAAGLQTLLETVGVSAEEVRAVHLAGGFGSHLRLDGAAGIGLIPRALAGRVRVAGNAALAGAGLLLLDERRVADANRIAAASKHVSLGGNPRFNEHYMEQMLFPTEDC